ncbi:MAG TPA: twin-arginine translocation signal domain-containing protein [Dehalococcoidia bacterium]|nr:twin-arginine translocation signal domain-containing protein [Dehalococcoidia bacterium]
MTEEKKRSNPVSRREFIKGAGLVVGGGAVGAGITYPVVPKKEVIKEVPIEVIKEVIKEVPKEVIKEVPTAAVYEVLPPYGKPTIKFPGEQPETDIAFKGTFEEVLKHYREKMWSDGLPIIPPTVEKVEEFLKYTDYPADAELTRPLLPSYRIATPWSVAVNGVMAGCRPEYMPVLIAMTKAWAEPKFRVQDVSSTTGCTTITIINGPIKSQLGINFRQSYGHPGYQSNGSMGRFWTMFKRNLMELRIEPPTEMGAHGMNFLNLAGEDDASCEEYGWKTLAEQQGFQAGDNVVTTMSVLCQSEAPAIVGVTGDDFLSGICGQICEGACCQFQLFTGQYLFVIPGLVADVLARDGFDKDDMRDYLYNNARQTARYLETRLRVNQEGYYCQQVKDGKLPQMFCESEDPNRLVPIFIDPKKIFLIVDGDRARNRIECFMSNGGIGPMTSMKIELPENWDELYWDSQSRIDLMMKYGREFL